MTLPVYYTYKKSKNAKEKTMLIGLNQVYGMHYHSRAKLIKWFKAEVKKKLCDVKIAGNIRTHYTYYYKNSSSDAANIASVVDKMFIDALQEAQVIENDNVLKYTKSSWNVGGLDKNNPRIEVEIFEI